MPLVVFLSKVPLIIFRDGPNLAIDEMFLPGQVPATAQNAPVQQQQPQRPQPPGQPMMAGPVGQPGTVLYQQVQDQLNTLGVRVTRLETQGQEHFMATQAGFGGLRTYMGQQFSTVNKNLGRVLIQPPRQMWAASVRRHQAAAAAAAAAAGPVVVPADPLEVGQPAVAVAPPQADIPPLFRAELASRQEIKTLEDLWTEWEFGIGGRKPVKDWSRQESGQKRIKSTFSRRKLVWNCLRRHVNAGYGAPAACEKIRQVYGHSLSVTQLIIAMRDDERNGGHPNLRV